MKKSLMVLPVLFLLACVGNALSQNKSLINGTWEKGKLDNVKLFSIANGTLDEVASSKVSETGEFAFAFFPEKEGYYVVGLSPTAITHRYTFYFKPGDQLNFKVTADTYELVGENTPENKEMAKWHDFILPLEDKAIYFQKNLITYVEFFPLFEEKLEELKAYPRSETPNRIFNSTFEDFKKNDLLFSAITFIQTPRKAHPQDEDFCDYYKEINLPGLTQNTSILNYPGGLSLLLSSYMLTVKVDDKLTDDQKKAKLTDPVAQLLGGADSDLIKNDTIKGEIAVRLSRNIKIQASFIEFQDKYGKYVITESQKQRWKNQELSLIENVVSEDATDFRFTDKNDKEIALSDFKGKVVYIDVWATWCGPCKVEFPSLKKLEADYHGNDNIVFIGVNVDVSRDKQKWLDFLQKEQLPGIQIFAGDKAHNELMVPYGIKGIPRFILVGKDGKLVLADAPRPSSFEIRDIINATINKSK